MLKLIIPAILLRFIDLNRGGRSRASYILHCINYIMKNEIKVPYYNNEGNEIHDKSTRPNKIREDSNN